MYYKNNTRELVKAMRAEGKTYAEIGDAFGFTRQWAQTLATSIPASGVHRRTILAIPYKGLREWMLANEVSVKELERRCGCSVLRAVNGGGCTKDTVDAILGVTGLNYETCFEVENES